MIEAISLPATSKLIKLCGADPGRLIISPEGSLAITAIWEGQEPDPRCGVYVPLVGERAFQARWIDARGIRELSVLHIEGCDVQVRVAGLSNVPLGFDIKDESALPLGGLFVDSCGLRVVAESGSDAISLDLGSGKFAHIHDGRRCLAAREWTLILMRNQVQCFSADISAKATAAA